MSMLEHDSSPKSGGSRALSAIEMMILIVVALSGWGYLVSDGYSQSAAPVERPLAARELKSASQEAHVLAELEGWRDSRVAWHYQLADLAKNTPPSILLRTVSMKQELKTDNDGAPARSYTMEIRGKAKSDDSARSIEEFRKMLEARELVASAMVTSQMAAEVEDTVIFEQPFTIACRYAPQPLPSTAAPEKGGPLDGAKIQAEIRQISERYVLMPDREAQSRAVSAALKACVAKCGVKATEPEATGVSSLGDGDRWLRALGTGFGVSCSFGDVVRLVGEIERSNPYLAASSFDLSAAGAANGLVSLEITFQIPTWSHPDRAGRLLGEIPAIATEKAAPTGSEGVESKEPVEPEVAAEPMRPEAPTASPEIEQSPAAEDASEAPSWPKLPLKGVSKGVDGKYFAIIEGAGPLGEGDEVQARKSGYIFTWRIDVIDADGIKCKRLGMQKRE